MNNGKDIKPNASPRERHSSAMDIAEQDAQMKDKEVIEALFENAYILKLNLAQELPPLKENEPSRSIMLRSAASLALNAGMLEEAKSISLKGLAGYPTECVEQELFDVYREASKNQATE